MSKYIYIELQLIIYIRIILGTNRSENVSTITTPFYDYSTTTAQPNTTVLMDDDEDSKRAYYKSVGI